MSTSPTHQQARSQQTAERIVAAAIDLLGGKDFEALTVADIAAHAGVSVGGFYARFPGKDALLQYLNVTVFEGLLGQARERFSAAATRGSGARTVVESYVAMAVAGFREHRRVMQQVSLRSRTSTDDTFRERILAMNRELHDLFRSRLFERQGEMAHPDPRTAIDIALTAVSGAMREYVLFQEYRPQFDAVSDADLVRELTEMFCSYLRVER